MEAKQLQTLRDAERALSEVAETLDYPPDDSPDKKCPHNYLCDNAACQGVGCIRDMRDDFRAAIARAQTEAKP